MATYKKAGQDLVTRTNALMEKFHPELHQHEVKLDILLAFATTDSNGDQIGPALKRNGLQVPGLTKVNSLKSRTKGEGDAELLVDGDQWDDWTEAKQEALLDHLLQHLALRKDKDGNVRRDDLDRPKLYLRSYDRVVRWYDAVVRRHDYDSFEWQAFDDICQATKQMSLPFQEIMG